MVPITMKKI